MQVFKADVRCTPRRSCILGVVPVGAVHEPPVLNPFNLTPHPPLSRSPFSRWRRRLMRTCDARPYGLVYSGWACRGGSRTARFKPVYVCLMRDVEGADPYGRRLMRTCDARHDGLYIRGGAVGRGFISRRLKPIFQPSPAGEGGTEGDG